MKKITLFTCQPDKTSTHTNCQQWRLWRQSSPRLKVELKMCWAIWSTPPLWHIAYSYTLCFSLSHICTLCSTIVSKCSQAVSQECNRAEQSYPLKTHLCTLSASLILLFDLVISFLCTQETGWAWAVKMKHSSRGVIRAWKLKMRR